MTPENFAYWLQGYSEICGKTPTPTQWLIIQDHLKLLFKKDTPDRRSPMAEVVKHVAETMRKENEEREPQPQPKVFLEPSYCINKGGEVVRFPDGEDIKLC